MRTKLFILIVLAALLALGSYHLSGMGSPPAPELDLSRTRTSANGSYMVAIEPENPEIRLGELHAWIVTLTTADGAPVEDASFEVGGGMPDHNHGLPTSPRVTENLGGGRYRLEGVKFSMSGWWELRFDIVSGETRDSVIFNMVL